MTFTAYIERQKNLIKSRHDEEELYNLVHDEKSESEKLFDELNSFKGLNTMERLSFTRKI